MSSLALDRFVDLPRHCRVPYTFMDAYPRGWFAFPRRFFSRPATPRPSGQTPVAARPCSCDNPARGGPAPLARCRSGKGPLVPTGPQVILALKVAVAAVTVLLLASLVALARGRYRLHGRLNIAFFVLTVATLIAFEVLIRFLDPRLFYYFKDNPDLNQALFIHLCFSVPAALVMPLMLLTGLRHWWIAHVAL